MKNKQLLSYFLAFKIVLAWVCISRVIAGFCVGWIAWAMIWGLVYLMALVRMFGRGFDGH